jgi:alkanesulfonate monooxygenase SsuD/methylene tetrahydromethanopterin reductase-like flavin-dependent oxidoreductase (luciferase family)
VGAGWLEDEFRAFGYRFGTVGERFASLRETLEVLDALRSGEPAVYRGPTVRLEGARALPTSVQRPGVPVWVGGKGGPRLLDLAARHAVGWNAVWRWSPEAFGERARAAAEACDRLGRDPATFRLSVGLYGLFGEDEAAARAAFERGRAAMPGGAMDHDGYEDWRADTLSGTPEQVLERVRAFEALGVEELILSPWVLPFAIHEPEQVELFAERVIAPLRA